MESYGPRLSYQDLVEKRIGELIIRTVIDRDYSRLAELKMYLREQRYKSYVEKVLTELKIKYSDLEKLLEKG